MFKIFKSGRKAAGQRDTQELLGMLAAIDKSQAVIEFTLDGTILNANANFCSTMGYSLEEIRGKHHSMFADPAYAQSAEYRAFWAKLGRGEYDAGQYKRLGKGGREVWIQATYNPILDAQGKPYKVVKFATDITAAKLLRRRPRGPAGRREQGAGGHRVRAGWHHPHRQRELLQGDGLLAG